MRITHTGPSASNVKKPLIGKLMWFSFNLALNSRPQGPVVSKAFSLNGG